jgi:biopolymer transport protein ExbB
MLELFVKGGPLMYPLLGFSILSLAIIIERGIMLARARVPRTKLTEIVQALQQNDISNAEAQYQQLRGPVASLGRLVLSLKDVPETEIEKRISREGSRELKTLTRHLHLLELIGKISPMVGLSGTVLGLAGTFQTVAGLQTMADPSMLAGGIWEALITTVTGLFIAIPAIIFFHLYENRVKSISFEMKNHTETVVSVLKGKAEG